MPMLKLYLFIFEDRTDYIVQCINFKEAVMSMIVQYGFSNSILLKALKGFANNDVHEIVELCENLTDLRIYKVFIIDEVVYE